MNTQNIGDVLHATHTGFYKQGHTGALIMRFQDNTSTQLLVVKVAAQSDVDATAELDANLHGYEALKILGAGNLVPGNLRHVVFEEGIALIMDDLGNPLRTMIKGVEDFDVLWRDFFYAVCASRTKNAEDRVGCLPTFATEVISHPISAYFEIKRAKTYCKNRASDFKFVRYCVRVSVCLKYPESKFLMGPLWDFSINFSAIRFVGRVFSRIFLKKLTVNGG